MNTYAGYQSKLAVFVGRAEDIQQSVNEWLSHPAQQRITIHNILQSESMDTYPITITIWYRVS